jgi:hypothetical protein
MAKMGLRTRYILCNKDNIAKEDRFLRPLGSNTFQAAFDLGRWGSATKYGQK